MLQSKLFSKTKREVPKDEESINAQLLIKAGFIDKLAAGVYTFLPLGLRVLNKIENIIREEMDAVGGQEMLMPVLHPKENWQQTGRWKEFDVLFRLKGASGKEYALGPTHEEVLTPLAEQHIFSYKDLPKAVYQIQTKFRDEPRSKSGLLRGREFRMKDLYSFHADKQDLEKYYDKVGKAYEKIWQRLGVDKITYKTLASGGTFSKYSHEYQTLCKTGEDAIYLCNNKCRIAVNKDIIDKQKICPICGNKKLEQKKAIELGNIFLLNTKFSDAFGLKYTNEKGNLKPVYMGCYGLGSSRVMGALVEIFPDKQGIIWPKSVAPYKYHLLNFSKDDKVRDRADKLYQTLIKAGEEILYDDRQELTAGEKLQDADLTGIPYRVVLGDKTKNGKLEVKERNKKEVKMMSEEELMKTLRR